MVRILVINPGSTSTKIAIFEDVSLQLETTIRHDAKDIKAFKTSYDQETYRTAFIEAFLNRSPYTLKDMDIFVGRGGLIKPVESGTYLINEDMIDDLKKGTYGDHVSNLGIMIAYHLGLKANKPAYTMDPVVVDELSDIAKVSGLKGIERISLFHALNHKAVARRYAKEVGISYEELNLIVAHLGGGISIGLHKEGKVVDVNNALGGEGPFTIERAGTLPLFDAIKWALHTNMSFEEMKKFLLTKAGMHSYIGVDSGVELTKRIDNNDKEALFYLKAMVYKIIKEIGALYFANKGNIDAVILTGGLAYNPHVMKHLKDNMPNEIHVVVYPGEDELLALAEGAYRVKEGLIPLKEYKK